MSTQERANAAGRTSPRPGIEKPTDAIVRLTHTTICGTDLHILKGDVPAVEAGRTLGHEGIGAIEEVGDSLSSLKPGDQVLISCITSVRPFQASGPYLGFD